MYRDVGQDRRFLVESLQRSGICDCPSEKGEKKWQIIFITDRTGTNVQDKVNCN